MLLEMGNTEKGKSRGVEISSKKIHRPGYIDLFSEHF